MVALEQESTYAEYNSLQLQDLVDASDHPQTIPNSAVAGATGFELGDGEIKNRRTRRGKQINSPSDVLVLVNRRHPVLDLKTAHLNWVPLSMRWRDRRQYVRMPAAADHQPDEHNVA